MCCNWSRIQSQISLQPLSWVTRTPTIENFLRLFSSLSPHACFLSNQRPLTNRRTRSLLPSTPRSQCAIHSLNLSSPSPYQELTRSLLSNPPHRLRLQPHLSPRPCWTISRGCLTILSPRENLGTTGTFSFLSFRLSLTTTVTLRSNNFQSYCVPQSVQYPQFSQASMAMPMGCSFENSHQVYTMGDSGEHLTSTEGFPHPYNEEFLVRPQFVPY